MNEIYNNQDVGIYSGMWPLPTPDEDKNVLIGVKDSGIVANRDIVVNAGSPVNRDDISMQMMNPFKDPAWDSTPDTDFGAVDFRFPLYSREDNI